MGRGSRHSKNAGTMGAEGLTYGEKRALGYGTVNERLSKDAVGNFDDCALTLQPAVDPVATPEGYIFSREAIIENLVQQKKSLKRKLVAWEAQQQGDQRKAEELAAVEAEANLIAFDRQNHMGASASTTENLQRGIKEEAEALLSSKHTVSGVVNIKENVARQKEMRAFWMPSKTPEADNKLECPDTHTVCPASGKKLRLKDLIPVKFTRVPDGESGRYMDPVTRDTLTNKHRLVLLKPTGDVMLYDSFVKCVKPEGRYEGTRIKDKDVVELQRGGTGFAAHDGNKAQAKKHYHLGAGSGLADLRGQLAAGTSKGGLVFWN